jgi:Tol biopolymer transport system component/DNA-binding winged helix-turn-helix (wHTH) protein
LAGEFRVGEWLVEPQLNSISGPEKSTRVEPKVMRVLVCLAEHAGEVVPKQRLISSVWNGTFVTDDVLTRSISELRKVFGDDAKEPRFIETISRSGYRLIATVSSDGIKQEIGPEAAASPRDAATITQQRRRSRRWWAVATGAGVILIGTLVFWLRAPIPQPKVLSSTPITNDGRQKAWHYAPPGFFALVTDGSRIYFTELTRGPWSVVQVPAAGGEPVTIQIQTPFEKVLLFDVSPDGSKLMVGTFATLETEAPIWIVPVTGGPPYRLGDLLAHSAAWSPGGDIIVYGNGSELYLAQTDGAQPRKLAAVDGRPSWIRWSPDGQRLRFTVYDASTNSSSLWEVAADGAGLRPILAGWNGSSACCGNWTGDGKYYVFQSSLESTTNIWAVREKRNFLERADPEPVQLTTGPMNFSRPIPSKDGKKLFVMGELQRGELVRHDSKSGQFVNYLSGLSAEHLAFSRDGEWIAYVTYPEGTLWRSRTDGSDRIQLSLPPMLTGLPRWSPDGKRIAFVAGTPGEPWKINLVSSQGGAPEQLMQGEFNEDDPTWSPEGNRLAFGSSSYAGDGTLIRRAIHLLDISTGQVSKLPGSEGKFGPRWSPDGRHIVAQSADMKELLLFDVVTSNWVGLTRAEATNAVIIGWPHWSRDGKYINFLSWGYDMAVVRIRIGDHKLERVASLKDVPILLGVFGPWLGFAPDDSPVVLRHIGNQEIYALDWVAP